MNFLMNFSELKVFERLSEENRLQMKDILIDFLFRFKDKHPFSNSKSEGPMDIFDWVMDFMRVNKLIPSKSLRKEYSKSEFNKKMVLPSFNVLNEKIGMTKKVYDKLEQRYNSKGAFNYFFNPSIDIQIKVSTHSEGKGKAFKVGFFNKGTVRNYIWLYIQI